MEGCFMCTAATYKTKDFYFGRTFDNEYSYGEQVVIVSPYGQDKPSLRNDWYGAYRTELSALL